MSHVPGRPFQPGQSGNPNGRPKTKPLTDELRKLLRAKPDGSTQTNAHLVAERLIANAKAGDVPSARLLFEYIEGKPVQPVDVDLRMTAERLAGEFGLDPRDVVVEAERLAASNA